MAEEEKKEDTKKMEESPRPADAAAPARPEEAAKPGLMQKIKASRVEKSTLLGAALFGAMLVNAILLGLISAKPPKYVETVRPSVPGIEAALPPLPRDVPNPERHIDILLGMADTYRRLGQSDKALECYAQASRAFDASTHAQTMRYAPMEAADKLFTEGQFRKARARYYSFLSSADGLPTEDHELIQQAHFRIAECYLREALAEKETTAHKKEEGHR